jgi:amidase
VEEWDEQHIAWIEEMHTVARVQGIDAVMEDYDVDALVAPTSALPTRWDNTSHFWASTQLSASAGYPSVTIPIGYTEGVPAGLHFFGPAFTERRLIRFAAELERTLQARTTPKFLETTNYDDIYAPLPVNG